MEPTPHFDHYWNRDVASDRYELNTVLRVVRHSWHDSQDIYDISRSLHTYQRIAEQAAEKALLHELGLDK